MHLHILQFLIYCILCVAFVLARNYTYETKYIQVPVDHFSFVNNSTFKLRYLINDDYWKPSKTGPVFFYTGNEGDINMFAQNSGFIWETASEFSALVVFAEHRYYGKSLPFGNVSYSSPKYLGYLTSTQALADYVHLINHLQKESKEKQAVIAFGGSYGGMLAAWMRMKYPHIVQGAIASSAPIFQFTGLTACGAYSRVLTSVYAAADDACAACVRNSWPVIRDLGKTDEGKQWLSKQWLLCKPLKSQSNLDDFVDILTDIYSNLAMINYPYPTNFLSPVPANPVKAFCSRLHNCSSYSGKTLVKAIQGAMSIYTNYTGHVKCMDTDKSASSQLGEDGWDFQACTEMVMPMCSNNKEDMFEKQDWNFKTYAVECHKRWGVMPREHWAVSEYGGKDIGSASNIVFSNGLLDPWSTGGVLYNVSSSVIALLIPEGAHHLDLRAANPADPFSVLLARDFHKRAITIWIGRR